MSRKLTIDYIRKELSKEQYTLISTEYINAKTKLDSLCPNNHKYSVTWGNFKTGHRCPYCNNAIRKNDINLVISYMHSFGYTLISKVYHNRDEKLLVKCPVGHTFEISFGNFKNGRRCSHCYKYRKKTQTEINEYFSKFNYTVIGEYENANTKLKVICNRGHEYLTSYSKFSIGKRCPHCKLSTGHNRICTYLDKLGIKYINEYTLKDCNNYRIDIFIPQYNIGIEYDGQQHFKPIDRFGGIANLEATQKRDEIKNNYCALNGIRLIRIPYTEYNNIETILDKEIQINSKTSTTKNL